MTALPLIMQALITTVQTDSGDFVRAIHAAGHRIVLEAKGPVRWTYNTSATQAQVWSALTACKAGFATVSPYIPE